jgi:hypothetical protein
MRAWSVSSSQSPTSSPPSMRKGDENGNALMAGQLLENMTL